MKWHEIFVLVFIALSVALSAPGSAAAKNAAGNPTAEKIKFIGEFVMPTRWSGSRLPVGGISGLYFDAVKNQLLAVCDDSFSPPRVYTLDFTLTPEPKFTIAQETLLQPKKDKPYGPQTVDAEAITRLKDGTWLISSEGSIAKKLPTSVFNFSPDGVLKKEFQAPAAFTAIPHSGHMPNKGFEALDFNPQEDKVFAANEDPLRQDSYQSQGRRLVRIVSWSWHEKAGELTEQAQYPYLLEKAPAVNDLSDPNQSNGLVEIKSLGDKKFLVLERSWSPPKKMVINLYATDCGNASDIKSEMAVTAEKFSDKIRVCDKSPVVSLQKLLEKKAVSELDNTESFTLVQTKDKTYIVLAADDNFRKTQKNQFLVFLWLR